MSVPLSPAAASIKAIVPVGRDRIIVFTEHAHVVLRLKDTKP